MTRIAMWRATPVAISLIALFSFATVKKCLHAWFFRAPPPPPIIDDATPDQYPTSHDCMLEIYFLRAVEKFLIQHNTHSALSMSGSSSQINNDQTLTISIERFKIWWGLFDDAINGDPFKGEYLPPIDILMVWHGYMLSPLAYLQDCLRWRKMTLWNHQFPLELINNCIKSESIFEAPENLRRHFTDATGLTYDFPASTIERSTSSRKTSSSNPNYNPPGRTARSMLKKYVYTSGEPWKVDMLHTLGIHCDFIRKGGDLNWTTTESALSALDISRNRYLRFLLLHDRYPTEYFVPTWDIDLIWHTHQLWPLKYRDHHLKYLGQTLDHDVSADGNGDVRKWKLRTAELWRIEFSEALVLCFCDECIAQRH